MSGSAGRAAARTIRALVAGGVLERSRDAAAIERLQALARLIDDDAGARVVECPACQAPVEAGPDTTGVVRVSRELRFWWQAIRERREAVTQGASIDALFADLDEAARAGVPDPGPR